MSEDRSNAIAGLESILSGVGTFFIALNMLGGVASGIWLAFLGEWWALGLGLIGIFVSHLIISIALMPSYLVGAGGAAAAERGSKVGMYFFSFLSHLYTSALVTAWSIGILFLFLSMADGRTLIPLLIWSYGVALGPWQYLAGEEARAGTGDGAAQTTFFGQLAFVIAAAVTLTTDASIVTLAAVFGGVMLVNVGIQMLILGLTAGEVIEASREIQSGGW